MLYFCWGELNVWKLKKINRSWNKKIEERREIQNCYDNNCEENEVNKEWNIDSHIGYLRATSIDDLSYVVS